MKLKNESTIPFWENKEADNYSEFAVTIPSDIPVYQMMYEVVNPKGQVVLDYGCFRGNSSVRILQHQAAQVVGVDSVEVNIKEASRLFANYKNLQFVHVLPDQFIPSSFTFDLAYMSFVHPTISSYDVLEFTYKKIFKALKPGGCLVVLGLHPASLKKEHSFLFYKHKFLNGDVYSDGIPFANKLLLSDDNHVEFTDYCWTAATLNDIFKRVGFTSVEEVSLMYSNELLKGITDSVAKKYSIEWLDEWKAPLYQLFVVRK